MHDIECLKFLYTTLLSAVGLTVVALYLKAILSNRREMKLFKSFEYGTYLYFHHRGEIKRGYVHKNFPESKMLAINLDGIIVDVDYRLIILEL